MRIRDLYSSTYILHIGSKILRKQYLHAFSEFLLVLLCIKVHFVLKKNLPLSIEQSALNLETYLIEFHPSKMMTVHRVTYRISAINITKKNLQYG